MSLRQNDDPSACFSHLAEYVVRQQLLHVDIFEVQVPLQMELEDEWVGRLGSTVLNPLRSKSR